MNVLFVGPYKFNPVIDVEMAYLIFRDLITPIEDYCDNIYLLTSRENPRHIVDYLTEYYNIRLVTPTKIEEKLGRIGYILRGIVSVRKYNIDIVTNICGGISYGFDAAIISKVTNRKVVIRYSGNEIKTQSIIGVYNNSKGKILYTIDSLRQSIGVKLANRVIAMSPWEVRRLQQYVGDKDKIIHCPRGVDINIFRPQNKLNDGLFRVLFIGRKSKEKGYDIVLKVAENLENVDNIKFIIAGNFEQMVKKNIQFIGYIHPRDLPKLYETIDIVLLPSRSEGFPQVVAESLAMGKPCIVSEHIFGKYFDNLKFVVLCKLDPKDIAEKIMLLYSNPKLLRRISIFARKYAVNKLNKDIYGSVYKYILINEKNNHHY